MRTHLALLCAVAFAATASAQFDFGKLSKGFDTIKDVGKVAKGAAGIGPEEEKIIGDSVALEIVGRYGGVMRDDDIMRRVNVVGRAMARYSDRPELNWRFAVLDSDTVNAFSAPDGYVFITRGLYDQLTTDDLLAAVLGHEIAHIAKRHALNIVARGEFMSGAMSIANRQSSDVRQVNSQLAQFDLGIEKIINTLLEKGFDPTTEFEADTVGRNLAVQVGYAPGGLRTVLTNLQKHGGDSKKVFSTHPPLRDRLSHLPNDPLASAQ